MSIAAAGSLLLLVSLHLGVLAITALAAAITVVGAVGVVRTQTKDGTGFGSTP